MQIEEVEPQPAGAERDPSHNPCHAISHLEACRDVPLYGVLSTAVAALAAIRQASSAFVIGCTLVAPARQRLDSLGLLKPRFDASHAFEPSSGFAGLGLTSGEGPDAKGGNPAVSVAPARRRGAHQEGAAASCRTRGWRSARFQLGMQTRNHAGNQSGIGLQPERAAWSKEALRTAARPRCLPALPPVETHPVRLRRADDSALRSRALGE